MRTPDKTSRRAAGLAACSLAFALAAGTVAAGAPRRAGPPTLEGTWTANFILTVEASPQAPALVVSDKDAGPIAAAQGKAMADHFAMALDPEAPMLIALTDGLPIVRGERHTRLVVQPADGRLPYSAAVRKELERKSPPSPPVENPEQLDNNQRCLVGEGQPPLIQFVFENPMQIVRTRDAVVLHTEYGDDVRIVPLTDHHAPGALWSRLGDSIGRWEGRTLVIETVGMPDADRRRTGPTMIVPGDATVIERLTPVSDRELLYQFTVIDPKAFSGPWLAEFSWYRTDKLLYEHACHEGNYSLANVLAGARYEEKAAARAAAAGQGTPP
jgi:hypothetical protein